MGATHSRSRAPTNASRSRGARAEQSREGDADSEVAGLSDDAKGELFYAEAVERMNKGDYVTSVAMLNRAVKYAGAPTRRGAFAASGE